MRCKSSVSRTSFLPGFSLLSLSQRNQTFAFPFCCFIFPKLSLPSFSICSRLKDKRSFLRSGNILIGQKIEFHISHFRKGLKEIVAPEIFSFSVQQKAGKEFMERMPFVPLPYRKPEKRSCRYFFNWFFFRVLRK